MNAPALAADMLAPDRATILFLVFMRLSSLMLMSATFGAAVPLLVRLTLALALSTCLGLGLEITSPLAAASTWELAAAALRELGLGAVMALGVNMAFAAFSMGGRLLDVQIGFGMGQVLDPVSRHQVPILSGAMSQLALVGFFSSSAFATLLLGLQMSFERFPPGASWPLEPAIVVLAKQGGGLFSLGFALVAPVVFCLMLLEFALGVLARNVPQMNMFALALPLKVLAGIAALSLWLGGAGAAMSHAYASIFSFWNGVLR
ncbi:flagellar biosynthetic protein FliR [Roseateles toxinivorans]|uniref:Flagellar biosynthetic protein FliR n=1 Tax=Roseateles toxinivorans TaxID=270368 RepID=A0A4R6QGF6_9BURK|nr:flagellar biosynthetic protein FliR [Roseateles toxinivorans]TDP61410.1 flagellar biosynthetic protein FliR [Roseateles toxinivorans]